MTQLHPVTQQIGVDAVAQGQTSDRCAWSAGLFDQPQALTALLAWAGHTPTTDFDPAARREADLDRLLAEETGLPVLVAEEPLTCVVRGCGMALETMDRQGSIFTSD